MSTNLDTDPFMSTHGHIESLHNGYRLHRKVDRKDVYSDYTIEDLAKLDPKIPDVLTTLFDTHIACRKRVPLVWLHNTLSYMNNPLHLKDIFKSNYVVKEITSISFFEKDRTSVTISVMQYDYFCLEPKPYITGESETYITVACDELDKHFPGWLARYDVLTSLNTDKEELLECVFKYAPTTLTLDLPDETFG